MDARVKPGHDDRGEVSLVARMERKRNAGRAAPDCAEFIVGPRFAQARSDSSALPLPACHAAREASRHYRRHCPHTGPAFGWPEYRLQRAIQ